MELILENIYLYSSDKYLSPIVQGTYVLFVLYAFYRDIKPTIVRKNSTSGSVKRGANSMAKFYTTYVALAFLIVLITLNVKSAENHKLLFVIINIVSLAYLCFWNKWFRNKLLGLIMKSSEIEK